MNKNQKILLLVEGEKAEKELLERVFNEYNLSLNYQIYPYKTNIYVLYQTMFKGNEDSLDSLDLLRFLKSKDLGNVLFDENFSDILLVFDYDPQDPNFSFDKIKLMQDYFNESTDNGKIYINYPMIESYKHFKSLPDDEYMNRTVGLSQIKTYKTIVNRESKFQDIRRIKREHFDKIISYNIDKIDLLIHGIYNTITLKNKYINIDLEELLSFQNETLEKNNYLYVVNTCLFFICDYNINLIAVEIENV